MNALSKPIQANEIEWRIQSVRNGFRIVVPYITARAVMNRFDEQFTPSCWKSEFFQWGTGSVKCRISVRFDFNGISEWVHKEDGADNSNIEATKGGFSDSLKRCAVQWGIARDLYEYPLIRVKGDAKYLSFEHTKKLNLLAEGLANGKNFGEIINIE